MEKKDIWRDRESEIKRDKGTARQREETERQINRVTVILRDRETEKQRDRETE